MWARRIRERKDGSKWNAYDSYWSACGQYRCLPAPTDLTLSVCDDTRMLTP